MINTENDETLILDPLKSLQENHVGKKKNNLIPTIADYLEGQGHLLFAMTDYVSVYIKINFL